jgi:hypothetical protein
MPQLATPDDVEARLGRPLAADEYTRVEGLLDEATVLVTEWLGTTPDPAPDAVIIAVSRMAARALSNSAEPGVTSVQASAGPFAHAHTYSHGAASGGVWLARQDKTMLRRYRDRSVVSLATA